MSSMTDECVNTIGIDRGEGKELTDGQVAEIIKAYKADMMQEIEKRFARC